MPALATWFTRLRQDQASHVELSPYLRNHALSTFLPYELTLHEKASPQAAALRGFLAALSKYPASPDKALAALLSRVITQAETDESLAHATHGSDPDDALQLLRFTAPLGLLHAALAHNHAHHLSEAHTHIHGLDIPHAPRPGAPLLPVRDLYIAQASHELLPRSLHADIPVPPLVRGAGRGDVYGSSLWLGLEPTCTPWHRDPNPNLLCQLCAAKEVRLAPPAPGARLFRGVMATAAAVRAKDDGDHSRSAARAGNLRGVETMQGIERRLLLAAVWGGHVVKGAGDGDGCVLPVDLLDATPLQKARLEPGDALFIPKGWWHSVRSGGDQGALNGSVNWWFQ